MYVYVCMCQKEKKRKESKEDEQTLADFRSAHCCSQAKCQLVQTSTVTPHKLIFLVCYIIKILLTDLSWSVWENLYLGHVYRPHCDQSVLMILVKILPYRPTELS